MAGKIGRLPRIAGPRIAGARIAGARTAGTGPHADTGASATIAVYSVKGGVGKTTLAANLAWCSAQLEGRRTLLWDLDAAGGSGFLFGVDGPAKRLVEDVVSLDRDAAKLIRKTAFDRLDILPADESIRVLNEQLMRIGKRKRLARLAEELGQDYPRIVLDCPPVMNEVSAQIVRAADLVIVPLPPSPLSSRALDMVVREIAASTKHHPPILPVLSMLDMRRALHREAALANPGWPVVPYSSAVEQCAVRQQPVGAFAPANPAARRFAALWKAIESKLAQR